ncbi:MAG TPA: hypothetical protein VL049_27160 [Candidatus Dormibacteraeota bacterium]|nr:hypothetical protein [Candidatus Dormibacteraeota bacterium]
MRHVDITVSDLAASTAFYERVMPVLDFHRIADTATGEPLWAGDRIELCLMRAQPASLRPHDRYYYAVFFADPDGIKLEYVYTP